MAVKTPTLSVVRLAGVTDVLRNLNREIEQIKGRSQAGLLAAALYIRGEAQKLVPVVSGDLKGSAFTDSGKGLGGYWATVGFGVIYALDVHENKEKEERRRKRLGKNIPGYSSVGQWKYLEQPLLTKQKEILEHIAKRVKV